MTITYRLQNSGSKKPIYPFSVFLSASEIVKSYKSSFDEPEIQERGKKIANILFEKIWVNKSIEP
jgi:hypothetical protein